MTWVFMTVSPVASQVCFAPRKRAKLLSTVFQGHQKVKRLMPVRARWMIPGVKSQFGEFGSLANLKVHGCSKGTATAPPDCCHLRE